MKSKCDFQSRPIVSERLFRISIGSWSLGDTFKFIGRFRIFQWSIWLVNPSKIYLIEHMKQSRKEINKIGTRYIN